MDQFCFGHYDMTTSQKIKIIGYFFIVWPMDNCIKFSGQKSKKSALGFKGLSDVLVPRLLISHRRAYVPIL